MTMVDHDSARRGSLSDLSSRSANYSSQPVSETHLVPDFCTIRRGVRGTDMIQLYHNDHNMAVDGGAGGDSPHLPVHNGLRNNHFDTRNEAYYASNEGHRIPSNTHRTGSGLNHHPNEK